VPKDQETAFKNWINTALLQRMARAIVQVHPAFNQKRFLSIAAQLEPLELKARVRLVRDQLKLELPGDYPSALQILLKSIEGKQLKSFDLWPYTEFVQTYGLNHRSLSLNALSKFTQLFTSEFAVRPFLRVAEKETLAYLKKCATSKNVHLRRWASEGSRPRLPWGERLDAFISEPKKTLPILEILKNDPELYVRKSVANHLNDISKDHPAFVIEVLERWLKETRGDELQNINWIVNRALRTEIKAGSPAALRLIGVRQKPKIALNLFKINSTQFQLNEKLQMEIEIQSEANTSQKLVIDYVIQYMRSNGKLSPKVFKLKTLHLQPKQSLVIKKIHHLKPVTTRRHYPGQHFVDLQINGQQVGSLSWNLTINE
jgi:3-methyladenine DNA glycosylase AlkC